MSLLFKLRHRVPRPYNKLNFVFAGFCDKSKEDVGDLKSNTMDKKEVIKTDLKDEVKTEESTGQLEEAELYQPYTDRLDEVKYLAPWEDGYDKSKDIYLHGHYHWFEYPQMFMRENYGMARAAKAIKSDLSLFFKEGRIQRRPDEIPVRQSDILIFGGGIIGSAIAYFLKERLSRSVDVTVLEKDPSYQTASTPLAVGGIRQQFSLQENILMAMHSAEFLRNHKLALKVLDEEPPDINFSPHGYLTLATEEGAEQLIENHALQVELGAFVDILPPHKLQQKFPWLNLDGIALGTYGVQNEGWFDPYALMVGFKMKAEELGAQFVQAEVIGFNKRSDQHSAGRDDSNKPFTHVNHVIIREPDRIVRQIEFGTGIIACGAYSGQIARMLNLGSPKLGIRSVPLPVEPRKRYVYVINCPDGPGIDFPLLIDPTGVYCRRDGLGGNYLCGLNPSEEEEPDTSNLDVDYNFFDEKVWPILANRVKAFETLKMQNAWAGYYDYNWFDQNAIIGRHPYFWNFIWATGFSGHGVQMAPAVGKAVTELYVEGRFKTIDLQRFSWNRIISREPLKEKNIY